MAAIPTPGRSLFNSYKLRATSGKPDQRNYGLFLAACSLRLAAQLTIPEESDTNKNNQKEQGWIYIRPFLLYLKHKSLKPV
jgi:hypothetical protein